MTGVTELFDWVAAITPIKKDDAVDADSS